MGKGIRLHTLTLIPLAEEVEIEQLLPIVEESDSIPRDITSTQGVLSAEEVDVAVKFFRSTTKSTESEATDAEEVLQRIFATPAQKVSYIEEEQFDVYTFYVPLKSDRQFGNLILRYQDGEVDEAYFLLYIMDDEFATDFNALSEPFANFKGQLKMFSLDRFLKLINKVGFDEKGNEGDCFTYNFRGPTGSTGGGGSGGGTMGNEPSGRPAGNTGEPVGGPTYSGPTIGPGPTNNGGTASPGGSGSPSGGNNGSTGGANKVCNQRVIYDDGLVVVTRVDYCDGRIEFHRTIRENILTSPPPPSDTKALFEDCPPLLKLAGIVPRSLSSKTTNSLALDRIESLVNKTPFNINAVLSIIDVAAFTTCYLANSNDVTCITKQVEAYLNKLLYRPAPGTIQRNFSSLPSETLAVFLNAAVTANGDQRILDALTYAGSNLTKFKDLPLDQQILSLIAIRKSAGSTAAFTTLANIYASVVRNTYWNFEQTDLNYLIKNIAKFGKVAALADQYKSFNSHYLVYLYRTRGFEVVPFERTKNAFLTYYYPLSSEFVPAPPVPEIQNGVDIVLVDASTKNIESLPHAAMYKPRGNVDDLRTNQSLEGVDGATGIIEERSQTACWNWMNILGDATSVSASSYGEQASDEYIARFRSNSASDYTNDKLRIEVQRTPEWKNAVKTFGKNLVSVINKECKANPSKCGLASTYNAMKAELPIAQRPKFEVATYGKRALTFLINDTEATYFNIERLYVNPSTGRWTATVHMEIIDHFGLDYNDVIAYQDLRIKYIKFGKGFSSWYLLQNKYKIKPFRSKLRYKIELAGQL